MSSGLAAGFLLDRQWHLLRGEIDTTKKATLVTLARILAKSNVPYAIIGGVALQVHHPDPRTTLDIDVAVASRDDIPRAQLIEAGFQLTGEFERFEYWISSDETPVQFTDDPALASAISSADETALDDITLRVINVKALLHEKIRAGFDLARRRSKRFQDLADI